MLIIKLHHAPPYTSEEQISFIDETQIESIAFTGAATEIITKNGRERVFAGFLKGADEYQALIEKDGKFRPGILEATERSYRECSKVRDAMVKKQQEMQEANQRRVVPIGGGPIKVQ